MSTLIDGVRHRLDAQWENFFPKSKRQDNKADLETVLRKLKSGDWNMNTYYRNNVPTFVRLPK